jgi:hypothetical protein
VVWVYRRTQWVALMSTDLDLSIEQIIEYYSARWKIEIDQPFCLLKSLFGIEKSSDLLRPASWCMAQLA